jgi:uncharacterized protein YjiS (DUF1127 family)
MATLVGPALAPHRNRSLGARLWAAYDLGRTRARLRELPDHMLEDIGVTRSEAEKESHGRSWDVPAWWRG